MPEAGARMPPAAVAAHSDPMTPKPMTQSKIKKDSKARIVLDIALQVLFYASLIGAFWLITFFMP